MFSLRRGHQNTNIRKGTPALLVSAPAMVAKGYLLGPPHRNVIGAYAFHRVQRIVICRCVGKTIGAVDPKLQHNNCECFDLTRSPRISIRTFQTWIVQNPSETTNCGEPFRCGWSFVFEDVVGREEDVKLADAKRFGRRSPKTRVFTSLF